MTLYMQLHLPRQGGTEGDGGGRRGPAVTANTFQV